MKARGQWITPPRAGSTATTVRLFCLPHAGAGTAMYNQWQRALPSFVEVCPILLPGRESRLSEACVTESADLIARISEAVAEYLDKPYAVFGHSMGALLASELSHALVAGGQRAPGHLFVSGRNASHLPLHQRHLHQLPDDEFLAELDTRYGGLPKEILETPDLLELYLPILRADLTLLETHEYQLRGKLSCPLSVLAGKEDANISEAKLQAWSEHTTGPFELQWFEGGHFYLTGTSKPLLLALVSERLRALAAGSG